MSQWPLYLAPSLLSANFAYLADEINKITSGGADLLHLDVMDGHFVNNITFGPCVIEAIKEVSSLPLDTHLMIAEPEKHIDAFLTAGSDSITFHIEATNSPNKIIEKIKTKGAKVAVAIKPKTDIGTIKSLLPDLDMVLLMSVEPGFGGQKFIPETLDRLHELRALSGCPDDIQVDGGINDQTICQVIEAGANVLVVGSYIFKNHDPAAVTRDLKNTISQQTKK